MAKSIDEYKDRFSSPVGMKITKKTKAMKELEKGNKVKSVKRTKKGK